MHRSIMCPFQHDIWNKVYQVYKNPSYSRKEEKWKQDSLWVKDRLHRSSLADSMSSLTALSLSLSSARALSVTHTQRSVWAQNWKCLEIQRAKQRHRYRLQFTLHMYTSYGKPSLHSNRPTGERRRLITVSRGRRRAAGWQRVYTHSCLVGGWGYRRGREY